MILPLPLKEKIASKLKAGDFVAIYGKVMVARDLTLEKMSVEKKTDVLKRALIYYCGPVIVDGKVVSAGPTTSSRMDSSAGKLVSSGVRGIMGKGKIGSQAMRMLKGRCVYFEAPGGCGALLASKIIKHRIIAYSRLGAQALMEFTVKDFPALVAFDIRGRHIW